MKYLKCQFIALAVFLIFSTNINAQNWDNPADRYLNEYKKYLDATCPIAQDSIQHFVYFSRDRGQIINHPFLSHFSFKGAQIMYAWRELEPEKGKYDFSKIKADVEYLKKYGKKLFVQLQDATFSPKYKAIPRYLLTKEYDGGSVVQYNDEGEPEGWVAKRWNEKVRARFALLLMELGKAFDGKIEGINLQESAIGVNATTDSSFSELAYVKGLKANMRALKKAFPTSVTMIYANFMPGEWLPWNDKGYLRSIYQYGNEIGVGLGAPDLMVTRKGQLNNPLALMHEENYLVPIGIAVQDGNYIGRTGADADYNKAIGKNDQSRINLVPLLHQFAKEFLKVKYLFWGNQAPYFQKDVLPCFGEP